MCSSVVTTLNCVLDLPRCLNPSIMDVLKVTFARVVPRLLELAGSRVYEVYYLPRHPPPATGVLLSLCDVIPPEFLLVLLCSGTFLLCRRMFRRCLWIVRRVLRFWTPASALAVIAPLHIPTPPQYLPVRPSPPQLTEFARLVAPYLAANQLTALHQPDRFPMIPNTPADTPIPHCPQCQHYPSSVPTSSAAVTPASPLPQPEPMPTRQTRSMANRRQ